MTSVTVDENQVQVVEVERQGVTVVQVQIPGPQGPGAAATDIPFTPSGNLSSSNVQDAIEELDGEKQPLDADLTSWAGVTRASGFDTFAATPSSANLASLVTGETGTGALVFGTSPGFTTAANPVSNDGAALGTTVLQWSDLFLAEGGVINWDNGDITLTQTGNTLAIAGATTVQITETNPFFKVIEGGSGTQSTVQLYNTAGGTDQKTFEFFQNNSSFQLRFVNDAYTLSDTIFLASRQAGSYLVNQIQFGGAVVPDTNDGFALGSTALQWSDLFLAEGGVINWDNSDATLTQTGNAVSLAGAAFTQVDATASFRVLVSGIGQATASLDTAGNLGGMLVLDDSTAGANRGGAIIFSNASEARKFAAIKGLLQNGANNTQGDIVFLGRTNTTDSTLSEYARLNSVSALWSFSVPTVPATNDLAALGSNTLRWSDLFTADGSVIDMGASGSRATITHVAASDSIIIHADPDNATASTAITLSTDGTARMTIGPGVQLGAPTGGDKGAGTLNAAGDIYKNNTAYTNPDYALEHYFTGKIERFAENEGAAGYAGLTPLEMLEDRLREQMRLPGIHDGPMGMFERGDKVLEKLEEAHIYITQLHNRVSELERMQ